MKKLVYLIFLSCLSIQAMAQNFGLQFDGNDSRLQLCNSSDFNIGQNFTVEAWIFASNWRAEAWRGSIVTKDMQGPDSGFAFRAGQNGTLSFVIGVGAWPEIQTEPLMNTDQWYHVAGVKSGSTLQLYVNGQLAATGSITGEPVSNTQPLTIGASAGFPGRVWDGFLDEIRVWNVARTPQEISDNQATEFTGNEPGLVAYLPMNEGSGSMTANLSDGSCNASLVNVDETDWVEGFSIPSQDVGVTSITAPDIISIFQKPVKIRAEIQNFGTEAVSNIPVEVSINGLPAFTETFNITIPAGETAEVVFDRIVDLSDNNTNLLSLSTLLPDDGNTLNNSNNIRYRKPQDGNIVTILNEEQFNFAAAGQTKFTTMNLPENTEQFEQLLLHISVECPSTGCDPWDQPGKISVDTDQGSHEITRFITPFGIGCGAWTVDVTDFKSILKGNVTFQSFLQVWGPSGWLTNVELEYIAGESPRFNTFTPLWETNNWVYGDPGVSDDLPAQSLNMNENTETSHIRMTISGHGQGNTDNAAEFSQRTHNFSINGQIVSSQNLWNTDCAQNGCANQLGTWQLSRAGWCPGQAVEPFILNTTGVVAPGEGMTIDYILEDYTNFLNTGYDGAGHTEPHYRIFSYFIESSDTRFEDFQNLKADKISIVTNGDVTNPAINALEFTVTNTGNLEVSNPTISYYVNEEFVAEQTENISLAPGESRTFSFANISGFDFDDDNIVFAVVTSDGDQNLSDDATKASINEDLVNVLEIEQAKVKLSPNPSSGIINMEVEDAFINGEVHVINILGSIVSTQKIVTTNSRITLDTPGVYFFNFVTSQGTHRTERVVIE